VKEIKLKNLNETIYEHIDDSGLKTYMWVNEKVNSCYMTLSVRYGSIHTDFKVGNKKFKVPNGLAHFLEHIKFNESDDYTAHDFYYKSGGDANAFTTFDFTSYLIFSTENLADNLRHLLDFVYNPFFTKKLINKEKGIITEEANMGSDDSHSLSYYLLLQNMFHELNYRNFITGTPEDIKEISLDHIVNVYNNFYHPENMFLCITGNFNPYDMAKTISETMSSKEFSLYVKPVIQKGKEPKEVVKEIETIQMNVTSPKVKYGLKIPRSKFKNIDDFSLRALLPVLLNANFGNTSDFKEELTSKGLITSLYPSAGIYDEFVVIMITADTNYVDEVISRIENQIANLKVDKKEIMRKIKANVATLILDFDDIEKVNSLIQDDLINYHKIIDDALERYKSLSIESFKDVASAIGLQNKSILIINPEKEDEKKN